MRLLTLVCFVVVGCAAARRARRRIGCRRFRPTRLTDAQRTAIEEFKAARSVRHLGAVRAAAAQPRSDEPRPRDGRLPAVQELAAAAVERVRDSADGATLDAAVRVERAQAAGAPGRAEGGDHRGDRRGAAAGSDGCRRRSDLRAIGTRCSATRARATRPMRRAVAKIGEPASSTCSASPATTPLLAMVMNTARTPLPAGIASPLLPPLK